MFQKNVIINALILILLGFLTACDSKDDVNISKDTSTNTAPKDIDEVKLKELGSDFASTPFKVLSISQNTFDGGPAISIVLSTPIDPRSNFRSYFTISDKEGNPITGDWIVSETLNVLYFPFIEAETQYEIAVLEGLKSVSGRLLTKEVNQSITTSRRKISLRFSSAGSQLSPTLSDGLTVEAINVDSVDIDFHRVKDSKLGVFARRQLGNSYYDLEDLGSFSELHYSARFDLNHEINKKRQSVLALKDIKELNQPGVYIAIMRPAGSYPYDYQVTWFSISDIALQVRQYDRELVAFTHHVEDVKPANDVSIRLIDKDSDTVSETKTSKNGFAKISGEMSKATIAIAEKGDHLAIIKLNKPALDLSEFKLRGREQRPLELFIYGPRDVYRPGGEVFINALLRDHDGKLVEQQEVKVRIVKPDGRVHRSLIWQPEALGFYEYSFQLPKTTVNGDWRFEATLGNGDIFEFPFQVEDFLPERMKLQLASENDTAKLSEEDIEIKIQGDYLYGAPASGNRITVDYRLSQARTLFEQYDSFVFGAADYSDFNYYEESRESNLDEKGSADFIIASDWGSAQYPLRLNTRISLYESGGRPVTRSMSHQIWPQESVFGIRPVWDDEIAKPNSKAGFEVIHVNRKEDLLAAQDIQLELVRVDSNGYWHWNGGWDHQENDRELIVYQRQVSWDEGQRMSLDVPLEYGNYRFEVKKNGVVLASYKFFAGWRWDRQEDGATGRPDQVTLSWNKGTYSAGELAQLTIDSPYTGTALITIESDELLWHSQVQLEANKQTLNIPVESHWQRHDIYATATVIRSGEAEHKSLPKRAFGLLHLPLDRDSRELSVSVSAPQSVLPETQVMVDIDVSGLNNREAFVTLAAVDSGVLSLSNFKTPSAFDWFFEKRQFQSEIRDTWQAFIEQQSSRLARQRFGGDAEELSRGGDAPQSDVQVVSLFSGKVAVNSEGKASIPLNLPYFNGELRLMALAFNNDQFGHTEEKLTVAAPLIAEVSLPRFLATGDKTMATFDIQNLTDGVASLLVKASSDASLGNTELEKSIELSSGEKSILQLPLEGMTTAGAGEITLTVSQQKPSEKIQTIENDPLNLKRSWRLGLRAPYFPETIKLENVLKSGEQVQIPANMLNGWLPHGKQLVTNVSSRPPFNADEHVGHLISYPYGCLEQTTSRAWPILKATDADLKRLDSTANTSIAGQRSQWIEKAISRILSMQKSDGSFGLWNNQSNENHWMTVFATDFLLNAQKMGYSIDEKSLKDALDRLNYYITTESRLWSEHDHYSQWPNHYHFSYRAYAALVMAKQQKVKLGDLRNLYDRHNKNSKSRLPYAQIALALELAGDTKRSEEAWQKAFADTPRETGYSGDYGSAVRDMAWTMTLANDSRLAKDTWSLLFNLRDELHNQRWLSTQERFALYQLGKAIENNPSSPVAAKMVISGAEELINSEDMWMGHWRDNLIPETMSIQNTGKEVLYTSIEAQGFPLQTPDATESGISIRREFYSDTGKVLDLKTVRTGDLILVRLDLQSTKEYYLPDALLIDLLPAGLELENQNLASAVKMDDMIIEGQTVSDWVYDTDIKHTEYRDDRFVTALGLNRGNSTVFYLTRAVTPGEYQIPPTLVEDMYRPYIRAVSEAPEQLVISPK